MPYREQNRWRFSEEQERGGAGSRMKGRMRAVAVLAATLCALLATACDRGDHPARIGAAAPEFTVSDGAQSVNLEKLRGHVVILNFWATSCFPCVEEVPSLVELQHQMPQVTVIAISDDPDAAVYRQFLADNHVQFQTVRDTSERVRSLYGTIKIPETYVIDSNGILRRKFVSAQNWTSPEIMNYLGKL